MEVLSGDDCFRKLDEPYYILFYFTASWCGPCQRVYPHLVELMETYDKNILQCFKIDIDDVIVFHDDLDVDFGKIKAKFGGSSAGHNGIESIDKFIGKEYSRVRVGIGKPDKKIPVSDYVLNNFNEDEKIQLGQITMNIIESIPILIDKKLDLFSSTVNNK